MTTSSSEIIIDSRSLDAQIWALAADDQWHRHKDALILLQQAHAQVREAEHRLKAQDKKIYELERLAATDPVTGLLNRRGFESFCAQELERTRRHNTPGSVLVLFDLDKFKHINDTYGHQAGDACLKKVADTLGRKIRSVDAAARLGGDEFALLLSHTDPEKSANCLNEIRYVMDSLQLVWEQHMISI
ncbi:MAG: GGDEF domain-containing protein, partial [Alphaproteobacteria bacterium]|nr:GGDEF domain-containing protein [Alphaproteobacteria bacterium]